MTKRKTTKKTVELKEVDLSAIFEEACSPVCASRCVEIMRQFPPGAYIDSIVKNLANYAPDIRSLLYHLAETYKPKRYLEIGVRRGYSMAMVALASPKTSIVGIDMWVANYGGEKNASPGAVEDQLRAMGYEYKIVFLNGNSHIILPQWFADHPGESFDLILVDADHTEAGALEDLQACLPHLSPGGFLVFDDLHDPELQRAWQAIQGQQPELEYYSKGIVGLIHKR
jgi:predicted O-methyltransferase YrrM